MCQTKPDSLVAAKQVDAVHDAFDVAAADGVICPKEIAELKQMLDTAKRAANVADTARALGVCVARGGIGGDRFVDLSTDYRRLKFASS